MDGSKLTKEKGRTLWHLVARYYLDLFLLRSYDLLTPP